MAAHACLVRSCYSLAPLLGTGVEVACGDGGGYAGDGDGCGMPICVTSYAHELLHWK
jgi:hypothetical protein